MSSEDAKYAKVTHYNKLVRDRMPERIAALGKPLAYHTATPEEYIKALWLKLEEEVAELKAEQTPTELADVLEVLHAIALELGTAPAELEHIRQQRASERGAFEKHIILEWS